MLAKSSAFFLAIRGRSSNINRGNTMSVNKTVCEIYEVVIGEANASIVIRTWDNVINGRTVFGGELLINSSYGTFCNVWSNTPVPFKQYLMQLSQDTFLFKTLGIQARVYCPSVTWEKFARKIDSFLVDETLTQAQVSLIMLTFSAEFEATNQSHGAYVETVERISVNTDILSEISSDIVDQVFGTLPLIQGLKPNPSGVAFWTQLWPAFTATVRHELEMASVCETA